MRRHVALAIKYLNFSITMPLCYVVVNSILMLCRPQSHSLPCYTAKTFIISYTSCLFISRDKRLLMKCYFNTAYYTVYEPKCIITSNYK